MLFRSLAREILDAAGSSERGVLWITHSPVGLDLVDRIVAMGRVDQPTREASARRRP